MNEESRTRLTAEVVEAAQHIVAVLGQHPLRGSGKCVPRPIATCRPCTCWPVGCATGHAAARRSSRASTGHCCHGGSYTHPMPDTWDAVAGGVMRLPSGRLIRGRGVRRPLPAGPSPSFTVFVLGQKPPTVPWEASWIRWRDFWLPSDRAHARAVLHQAWQRATNERVEVACGGGQGRTGTALACVAVLDGVPSSEAVAYVRAHYDARAVETPWQRRYVRHFS